METTTSNNTLQPLRPQTQDGYGHDKYIVENLKKRAEGVERSWILDRNFDAKRVKESILTNANNRAFVNGAGQEIHCPNELYEYAMAIKKVMPNVDFCYYNAGYIYNDHPIDSLAVYREGDIYAMGVIGYAHTSLFTGRSPNYGEVAKRQYITFSPYITNSKYRASSEAFHMKTATTLGSAMKNFKKFMRAYSPVDVAYTYLSRVEGKIYETCSKLRSKMHSVSYDAGRYIEEIFKELHALHTKQSDKITNHKVTEIMDKYMEQRGLALEETAKPVNVTFVLIRPDNSVATLEFHSPRRDGADMLQCVSTNTKLYHTTEEVPDDLQGAVSMLSMLKTHEYVDGVGTKQNDRAYWVIHED